MGILPSTVKVNVAVEVAVMFDRRRSRTVGAALTVNVAVLLLVVVVVVVPAAVDCCHHNGIAAASAKAGVCNGVAE